MKYLLTGFSVFWILSNAFVAEAAIQSTDQAETERRDRGPSWAPDNRQIVVYSFRGGWPDLYILSLDGGQTRLTQSDDRWELEPDWAPDGERIVFAAGPDMRSLGIYDIAADGSDERALFTEPGTVGSPQFSPDGTRIIFSYAAPGQRFAVYSMNRDGGDVQNLTPNPPVSILRPRYSPDGSRILAAGRMPVPDEVYTPAPGERRQSWGDLFLLSTSGEVIARLTDTPTARETFMSWSRDGQQIFFSRGEQGEANDLFVMDADGSNEIQLTSTSSRSEYFSRMSPDGRRLAFDTGDRIFWLPTDDLHATPMGVPD